MVYGSNMFYPLCLIVLGLHLLLPDGHGILARARNCEKCVEHGTQRDDVPEWLLQPERLEWAAFQKRFEEVGLEQVLLDLERAAYRSQKYQELAACLRLSVDALRNSPQELGFQVEARCLESNDPIVRQLLSTKPKDTEIEILSSSFDVPYGPAVRLIPSAFAGSHRLLMSPDGRLVVSTYDVWDVESGSRRCALEGGRDVYLPAACSHDNRLLATGNKENGITIHELQSGRILRAFPPHEVAIERIVFSPDDQALIIGDRKGRIRVIGVEDARCLANWQAHERAICGLIISKSGTLISTAESDECVRMWELGTGTELWTSMAFGYVREALQAPSGNWAVCRNSDDETFVVDLRDGCPQIKHRYNHFPASNFLFHEQTCKLVCSIGARICVIDLDSGSHRMSSRHDGQICNLQWLGDSDQLVAIEGRWRGPDKFHSARIWDYAKLLGSSREGKADQVTENFSSDSDEHLVSWANRRLQIKSRHDDQVIADWEMDVPLWVMLSRDGQWAAIVPENQPNGGVQIWHVPEGNLLHTLDVGSHIHEVQAQFVLVGDSWKFAASFLVWDVRSGQEVADFLPIDDTSSIITLNSLADKPWLWAMLDDGGIELWDLGLGKRTASIARERTRILEALMTFDRKSMLVNDYFGGYSLWDLRSSELSKSLSLGAGGNNTVLSPDDKMLATAYRHHGFVIWDIEADRCVKRLTFDATISHICWQRDIVTIYDGRGRTHKLRVLPRRQHE